jgi:hypothetical protein
MEFAKTIGLKDEWVQEGGIGAARNNNGKLVPYQRPPHFDLNESKRNQAIANGAIQLSIEEFVKKMRYVEKEKQCVNS